MRELQIFFNSADAESSSNDQMENRYEFLELSPR